jgi:dolichol kinase
MTQNQSLTFEIKRKLFHLLALTFPLCYLFLSKAYASLILLAITIFTVSVDIFRHYNSRIKEVVEDFFGKIMRSHEKNTRMLSGASFMALGFLCTALLFPKEITIMSWLVLIIADCSAAIIGMKYGKPLFNGKSLAGSAAFLACALIIGALGHFVLNYHNPGFVIIISALITTIIEFFSSSLHVNDNIAIPMAYAFLVSYALYM